MSSCFLAQTTRSRRSSSGIKSAHGGTTSVEHAEKEGDGVSEGVRVDRVAREAEK